MNEGSDAVALFGGRGEWVAGIYYLGNSEDLQRSYTYLESDFFSSYDTDTLALFGQLDTNLGNNLTLITGLRWERRETDYYTQAVLESTVQVNDERLRREPQKRAWRPRRASRGRRPRSLPGAEVAERRIVLPAACDLLSARPGLDPGPPRSRSRVRPGTGYLNLAIMSLMPGIVSI